MMIFFHLCSVIGWVALGQFWPLTRPVSPLGIASSRSHLVMQLAQGEEPWMPDQVDLSPAAAGEAQKGSGPGEWTPGKVMMSRLS